MISQRLKATILKTLGLDDYEIQAESRAFEIPGWDSLSHVDVITAVEDEYKIRLQTSEIMSLKKIGDLLTVAVHEPVGEVVLQRLPQLRIGVLGELA